MTIELLEEMIKEIRKDMNTIIHSMKTDDRRIKAIEIHLNMDKKEEKEEKEVVEKEYWTTFWPKTQGAYWYYGTLSDSDKPKFRKISVITTTIEDIIIYKRTKPNFHLNVGNIGVYVGARGVWLPYIEEEEIDIEEAIELFKNLPKME